MVSARGRRQQVGFAQSRGLSARRACALIGVARSTLGYAWRLPVKDAPVVAAMRDLSGSIRGTATDGSTSSSAARVSI